MNATITFATQARPNKAALHKKPRSARRSFFSAMDKLHEQLLKWLMSYPIAIV
jgi:hypothetical protein